MDERPLGRRVEEERAQRLDDVAYLPENEVVQARDAACRDRVLMIPMKDRVRRSGSGSTG
jgi:hypothetical protein